MTTNKSERKKVSDSDRNFFKAILNNSRRAEAKHQQRVADTTLSQRDLDRTYNFRRNR